MKKQLSATAPPFAPSGAAAAAPTAAAPAPAVAAPARSKKAKKETPKKLDKPCRYFQAGNCKRGDNCMFVHVARDAAPAAAPAKAGEGLFSFTELPTDAEAERKATYACPFCESMYSVEELGSHLQEEHAGDDASQVCPICAAEPGGDPNYRSQNIFGHFTLRHGGAGRGKGGYKTSVFAKAPKQPELHQPPPRVMKTCHALEGGHGMIGSRGVDFVWEYAWRYDNGKGLELLETPCVSCGGKLMHTEARAILPCGCTFHGGCISNEAQDVVCPVCSDQSCAPWPLSFQLKHVSSVPSIGYNTSGTIFYDYANVRMLMTNDQCPILQFLFKTDCDFRFVDSKVYLKTRLGLCCHFGAWDGLGPTPPTLMNNLNFNGLDIFNGIPAFRFNVTTDLGLHNFWTQQDEQCTPLGFFGPLPFPLHPKGWSVFDPAGFQEGPQDPSLFEKPSICLPCPAK